MTRSERFEAEFNRRLHGDPVSDLEAYCRARLADLPHGDRGVRAAGELLMAIPAACRLGWWDVTISAPDLFRRLKSEGLITACPSNANVPAALRLVDSVCDLVTQRSPRLWTVWFSSACDPDLPLGASIREAVTPTMLQRPRTKTSSPASVPQRHLPADDERAERLPASDFKAIQRLREEVSTLARELQELRAVCAALGADHLSQGALCAGETKTGKRRKTRVRHT